MNDLLLIALGTYTLVTTLRLLLARYDDRIALRTGSKFVLVLVCAGVLSAVLNDNVQDGVTEALAGAGLATVVHRIHRWLGAVGDLYRVQVVSGPRRR